MGISKEKEVRDMGFYTISMKTTTGKNLFLRADKGSACKWDFDKQEAIWYGTYFEAEKFAKSYFKNFKNYEIQPVYCNL